MKPPGLVDWALRRLVPPGVANDVIGDLREEYARFKLRELGPLRAGLWYWRQAVSVLIRYGRIRPERDRNPAFLARRGAAEPSSSWLDIGTDLRQATRALVRAPGFSFPVILTLALGTGVTTAVFSAVHGVLLAPLPFERPQELVTLGGSFHRMGPDAPRASLPEYRDYLRRASSLSDVAATWPADANLTGGTHPARLSVVQTTPNLFDLLGVEPTLGRSFSSYDFEGARGFVAVLSYSAWQRHFRGDPGLVGQEIILDGDTVSVVGVMPKEFRHPTERDSQPVDVWVPLDASEGTRFDLRWMRELILFGRLSRGTTIESSREELHRIADLQQIRHPAVYPPASGWTVSVAPLVEETVREARAPLLLLFGSAALVFLAVAANLATLQLSRRAARRTDSALRMALGGSRRRIARRVLVESALLGLVGALVGLGLATLGTFGIQSLLSPDFPRLGNVRIDPNVLGFALVTALLLVLVLGLLPALLDAPASVVQAGGGRRSGDGPGKGRRRGVLVHSQTAFSLVLLVGAGLLLKSYSAMEDVDSGFEPARVLTLQTWLPMPADPGRGAYRSARQRIALFEDVLHEMVGLPGVTGAAVTSLLPLRGYLGLPAYVDGDPRPVGRRIPTAEYRIVSDAYFDVMGIEILRGRSFQSRDRLGTPAVAVVSRAFADRYFPGTSPLGKRVRVGSFGAPALEIVGLVDDVGHEYLGGPPRETVYTSLRQNVATVVAMTFVLQTEGSPDSMGAPAVAALQRVDPELPAFSVVPLEEVVSAARADERTLAVLFAAFGLLTLVLLSVGIYAVVSLAVTGRAREIGIRLALGGARVGVLKLLLEAGLRQGAQGALMGLTVALVMARLLDSMLVEVNPLDPWIYTGATGLSLAVVVLASLVPALEALRVDPTEVVKAD